MRFAHIQNAVYREPWNITAGGWLSVHELLQSRLAVEYKAGAFDDWVHARPDMEVDRNGIAHIHVQGVLGKGLTNIEKTCGNTGYEQIEEEFRGAEERGAKAVMLHINSPGGAAIGNVETAKRIASSPLPIVAFVDELCASAAYCIAAGSDLIVCTESAQVGSIGTILPLIDTSGAWEAAGWKPAYITHTGGDLKDALWPPSFTEAHRAHLQEVVDDLFSGFRSHVTAHRAVEISSMRGQCLIGARAKNANLVDKIGNYESAYDAVIRRANRTGE